MSDAKSEVARVVYEQADRLVGLARAIHEDPEPAFSERRASARLVDLLSDSGFEIRTGAGALSTAFVASRGAGELHLTICAEYDALDAGIGHGSGRHLVAGAAMGAAMGLATFADERGLTLSVIGTPGADLLDLEVPPAAHLATGKSALLESGAFDHAHAVLMLIPASGSTGFGRTCARTRSRARLWSGGGSLRALSPRHLEDHLLSAAVARGARSASCRFAPPEDVDDITGEITLSATTLDQVTHAAREVRRELERIAAGLGLGLDVIEYEPVGELRNDLPLRRAFERNLAALGLAPSRSARLASSTDIGRVSLRVPAAAPMISTGATATPGTADFAAQTDTEDAYRVMLSAAVALCWTALDAAEHGELRSHLLAEE